MDGANAHDRSGPPRGERLDSWKEIAAYLKRDIRTVQRWEKLEGLPIHRHRHDERASAYAFTNEIDDWREQRQAQEHDSAMPAQRDGAAADESAAQSRSRGVRLAVWAMALAAAGAGALVWSLGRVHREAAPLVSLSVVFAPSERFFEWGPDIALSRDGTTLAYSSAAGDRQIRIRRIDRLESEVVEGAYGTAPFFSPDGRWIGFNTSHSAGQLMKVPVDGGTPVPLGASASIGEADWGIDDFIVYASTTPQGTHGLYRLRANGGTPPQLVATLDKESADAYWLTPQSVSNGNVILCTLARAVSSSSRFQVVAVSVATGERRLLVDDAKHGRYIGDGLLVYWRNNSLFATRLNLGRLETEGPHVPAWDRVVERERLRSWASESGTLVYWPDARVARRLVWIGRDGKQEPLPLPPARYQSPRLSPDGNRIAFAMSVSAEFGDLWMHDLTSGANVRLTNDGRSGTPLWTLDGSAIVYSTLGATGRDLMRLTLGAAPVSEPIFPGLLPGATKEPAAWADSGRTLLVAQHGLASEPTVWAVTLDGSGPPRPAVPTDMVGVIHASVSPDGRWIAYGGSAQQPDLYVAPILGGPPFWKVSSDGGTLPVWSRSGRELFYRHQDQMMSVAVTRGTTFTATAARPLFSGRFFEADPGAPNYDVALDDQRFLTVLLSDNEGPDRLNVVQGWRAEVLKRLNGSR